MINFYEELGIDAALSLAEIQEKLQYLEEVWTSRLTSSEAASEKMEQISQARLVFATEESRGEYDSQLAGKDIPDEKAERLKKFNYWFSQAQTYLDDQEYDLAKTAIDNSMIYVDETQITSFYYFIVFKIYAYNKASMQVLLDYINKAIVLNPDDPSLYINKGWILGKMSYETKNHEARMQYMKAIQKAELTGDESAKSSACGLLALSYVSEVRSLAREYGEEAIRLGNQSNYGRMAMDRLNDLEAREKAERERQEAERERQEAERKRIEEERQKAEAERKRKAEAERKRLEEERQKAEAERKRKAEAERKRLKEERQKAEAEKDRIAALRKTAKENNIRVFIVRNPYSSAYKPYIVFLVTPAFTKYFCIDDSSFSGKKIPVHTLPIHGLTAVFNKVERYGRFEIWGVVDGEAIPITIPYTGNNVQSDKMEYVLAVQADDDIYLNTVYLNKNGSIHVEHIETSDSRDTDRNKVYDHVPTTGKYIDADIAEDHYAAVNSDGTVSAWLRKKDEDYGQCDVENWRDVIKVCVGQYRTWGLCKDGKVLFTGKNNEDNNLKTKNNRYIDLCTVSGCEAFGLPYRGKGCFGYESTKNAKYIDNAIAIDAKDSYFVALCSDGTIFVKDKFKGTNSVVVSSIDEMFIDEHTPVKYDAPENAKYKEQEEREAKEKAERERQEAERKRIEEEKQKAEAERKRIEAKNAVPERTGGSEKPFLKSSGGKQNTAIQEKQNNVKERMQYCPSCGARLAKAGFLAKALHGATVVCRNCGRYW